MKESEISANLRTIEKTFLFNGVERGRIKALLGKTECEVRCFSSGEVVVEPGSREKALVIILSGKATVGNEREDGVLLRVFGKGDIFGAASLFTEGGFPTSVRSSGKLSALFIPEAVVSGFILENPESALAYIRFLTDKVRFLNSKINIFTAKSASGKLAAYLSGFGESVNVSLTALSEILDVGRASLYRSLDLFEKKGIITRNGRTITIIDRKSLTHADLLPSSEGLDKSQAGKGKK